MVPMRGKRPWWLPTAIDKLDRTTLAANNQWPMMGDRGAACRPRGPDRTVPLRSLAPTLARTAGHDIRHWALGIHWLLVIGHWALVIGHWSSGIAHWSCTILCQRLWTSGR